MPGMITHIPLFRMSIFYSVKLIISVTVIFLFIISISTGFSQEQITHENMAIPSISEPVYLIPDQSYSPFKFGVALTPEHVDRFNVPITRIYTDMNQLDDDRALARHANMSTVVRIVIDEFQCFSGLNQKINDMEKAMNCYTRKLMLTGELNLDPTNNQPSDYIEKVNLVAHIYNDNAQVKKSHYNYFNGILSQFEITKLSWNMGLNVNRPGISFKLDVGEAFMVYSSAGEEFRIGALIKLQI